MTVPAANSHSIKRIASHVPGLDVLLDGGFMNAGVYMIHGIPGSGKTILANQICFGHVAAGGKALYVTLLAESHARLTQYLRPMTFFDESAIPGKVSYISAFSELEAEGLKGLIDAAPGNAQP
jgi:circadian clock protein KaiC